MNGLRIWPCTLTANRPTAHCELCATTVLQGTKAKMHILGWGDTTHPDTWLLVCCDACYQKLVVESTAR
jgi:hypothetical protein